MLVVREGGKCLRVAHNHSQSGAVPDPATTTRGRPPHGQAMKARTTKTYTVSIRRNPRDQHWYIEVFTQPWKDYWWARLYHWYDMRIPVKIPGWRQFEKLLEWRGAENRPTKLGMGEPRDWKDRVYSWTVNQDMACYEYSQRNRKSLGTVEVDPVVWQKL